LARIKIMSGPEARAPEDAIQWPKLSTGYGFRRLKTVPAG
jgi:hypothetical protein